MGDRPGLAAPDASGAGGVAPDPDGTPRRRGRDERARRRGRRSPLAQQAGQHGDLKCLDLGRRPYAPVLRLQERLVDRVARGAGGAHLLLVEHDPPVITLGRRASAADVLGSPDRLAARGIEVHETSRGGGVTYHGPGQLVAYPIFRLKALGRDLRRYQRDLEEAVIRVLARYGITGSRIAGLTGVWVGGRKIAAIGVAVRRWVTYHGLALNVSTDLGGFRLIVPCGIADRGVTSMRALGVRASMAEVKLALAECVAEVFGFAGPPGRAVDAPATSDRA